MNATNLTEQEIIQFFIDNDILLSPEILINIKTLDLPIKSDFSVINEDVLNIICSKISISVDDFEKSIVLKQKHKNSKLYEKFVEYIAQNLSQNKKTLILKEFKSILIEENSEIKISPEIKKQQFETEQIKQIPPKLLDNLGEEELSNINYSSTIPKTREEIKLQTIEEEKQMEQEKEIFMTKNKIKIISSYNEKSKKRTVQDFVNHFTARYRELEKILRTRTELQNLTSIARINAKKEKDNVALIGFVYEKSVTKNKNIMLKIEDPTGFVSVVVSKNKEELFRLAEEIQLDEVIGITGTYDKIIFANNILLPDIPLHKELRKSPEEGYVVIMSDLHVGNKLFLEEDFKKFLSWLNQESGNEKQKEVASKIKYIFIVGDLVEGVGVYPDQEFDLNIVDIREQYIKLAEYLKEIPSHIPIFLCAGNHDVGRLSEPQATLYREYTEPLWNMKNLIFVSNPAVLNIFAQPEQGFEGFDINMYHGGSFIYYAFNIPAIRQKGALMRADLIMKYLLQRRHLAPAHTSTIYVPDPKRDPLVIEKVPDFFITGHIHRMSVTNYRNVTCINASCWVSQSDEQERRGMIPQPARIALINMQTREIKVMNFLSKEEQEQEAAKEAETQAKKNVDVDAAIAGLI